MVKLSRQSELGWRLFVSEMLRVPEKGMQSATRTHYVRTLTA